MSCLSNRISSKQPFKVCKPQIRGRSWLSHKRKVIINHTAIQHFAYVTIPNVYNWYQLKIDKCHCPWQWKALAKFSCFVKRLTNLAVYDLTKDLALIFSSQAIIAKQETSQTNKVLIETQNCPIDKQGVMKANISSSMLELNYSLSMVTFCLHSKIYV